VEECPKENKKRLTSCSRAVKWVVRIFRCRLSTSGEVRYRRSTAVRSWFIFRHTRPDLITTRLSMAKEMRVYWVAGIAKQACRKMGVRLRGQLATRQQGGTRGGAGPLQT
jgi:hypothetical protein